MWIRHAATDDAGDLGHRFLDALNHRLVPELLLSTAYFELSRCRVRSVSRLSQSASPGFELQVGIRQQSQAFEPALMVRAAAAMGAACSAAAAASVGRQPAPREGSVAVAATAVPTEAAATAKAAAGWAEAAKVTAACSRRTQIHQRAPRKSPLP